VAGEDEWAARVELHRDVWSPSRVTLEAYRRLRAAPIYRPDLDLVVIAPDGTLASYAICWLDAANRSGEFEPVGTRAAFRGQGLGKAVVQEGFRRLRACGARVACVTAVGGNMAAQKLYASAGFQTVTREHLYRKPLEQ
jgi:ribosomal protein S18 acetylase RimI-like enzyme